MYILLPKEIKPEMLAPGTSIPEIDTAAGEVAWVSGGSAAVGDRRIYGGYTYECVQAVAAAPQNTYTPDDPRSAAYWLKDEGAPSNRQAPFDKYLYTKAKKPGSITYEIDTGFINGLAIYGVEGDSVEVEVTANSVQLMPTITQELWEQAYGEFEYLFGELERSTYFTVKDLPLHPNLRLKVTVSRNVGTEQAAIGFMNIGTWKRLVLPQQREANAAQYGVEATTKDYSYVKDNEDGTYTEIPGRKATNINLTCWIAASEAAATKNLLDQILGKAVAIEVSDLPGYSHLATVAKITGTVRSVSYSVAEVDLQCKGNV